MEIIDFNLKPTIRPSRVINPIQYTKTKPVVIKINKDIHCRICSQIAGKAVEHDDKMLHADTCKTETKIDTALIINKSNKEKNNG